MSDTRTIDVYNARADEYAAKFGKDTPDAHLSQFINALPAGGVVLDLGCGTGDASAHMVAAGLDVTGMDASTQMLAHARAKSNATFIEARFDDLVDVSVYHGVWANFSLLHAPRDDMPGHLNAIHTALRPEGIFHLGLKTGGGDARDGIDRYYTYYSEEDLSQLLDQAGFEQLSATHGQSGGLAGQVEPWIIILARKLS